MPIRVQCVDDSADITQLISLALSAEEDMQVVGVLNSTDHLVRNVGAAAPDVLVFDLNMPGIDPYRSLQQLSDACPDTKVIVFSGHDDQDTIDRVLGAGAWGYVSKGVDLPKLVHGIRDVAAGNVVTLR